MKVKILKDSEGNVVATSEVQEDGSIELAPKEDEGYKVDVANVEDDYKSDLGAFYNKSRKNSKRTDLNENRM
jgi:hypothetical protein